MWLLIEDQKKESWYVVYHMYASKNEPVHIW